MEDYVGICGQKGAFNLFNKAGGEINTSGIFRFAYNIDLAKSTYSIKSIKEGKPRTIYEEMIAKTGEASFKEIQKGQLDFTATNKGTSLGNLLKEIYHESIMKKRDIFTQVH